MYRHVLPGARWLTLAAAFCLGACETRGSRENVEATATLVATQTPTGFTWWHRAGDDAAARLRAEAMLADGVTVNEAVAIAFLASPDLQLALEHLEISRSDLVAASTPPNPVAIIGVRDPGGSLAAFYPDRNVSVGVLQNVMALLNLPDRRAVARHDLQRTQFETADRITGIAAEVTQSWFEYAAALKIRSLRERAAAAARATLDTIIVRAANGGLTDLNVAVQRNATFSTEGAVVRADVDMATHREKLARLLGVAGWHDDWQLADALPALPAVDPDPATAEQAAMERRFDIRAASKRVDARLRVLAMQRRFRWLGSLELGMFREKAIGGTAFTGPNAVVEIPLFDQRQAQLLAADAELRSALRSLEVTRLNARSELRTHAAEMHSIRALLEQYERSVQPNQRQIVTLLGTVAEPGEPERLRLRLAMLSGEEEQVGLLRDYWRARSAFALAAGDWSLLNGL
jgi:outer membrane protein, heavy metal efflux system